MCTSLFPYYCNVVWCLCDACSYVNIYGFGGGGFLSDIVCNMVAAYGSSNFHIDLSTNLNESINLTRGLTYFFVMRRINCTFNYLTYIPGVPKGCFQTGA